MLVQQFPDINWLKQKIKENFSDRRALNNVVLEHPGWPTILLNAKAKSTERKDIKGPFSIFLNLSGTSQVSLEGKHLMLNDQCYTTSNFDQHYDLVINDDQVTETLNIHFGEHFYYDSLHSIKKKEEELLDQPQAFSREVENLTPGTLFRDSQFNGLIQDVLEAYRSDLDLQTKEDRLYQLLAYSLVNNSKELKKLSSIKTKKVSTKEELAKRLTVARDYIHSNYFKDISLEELSQVSCMSKFHFLRVFKETFACTPYQYIKQLRFSKAMPMITQTSLALEEIAAQVGFENASSLSRFIHQRTQHYPSHFRN